MSKNHNRNWLCTSHSLSWPDHEDQAKQIQRELAECQLGTNFANHTLKQTSEQSVFGILLP